MNNKKKQSKNLDSDSQLIEKINYDIKRESKKITFDDVNSLEEESNYLIELKKDVKEGEKYLLETPYSFVQIPEDIRISISPKLMEIDSKDVYEKIIWFYIFEIIFGDKRESSGWKDFREDLKSKIKVDFLTKNWISVRKDISVSDDIKDKLRKIHLKGIFEEKNTLKDILEYPNKKRKTVFIQSWNLKNYFVLILFSIFLFSIMIPFFKITEFHATYLSLIIILLVLIPIYFLLYQIFIRKSLLKGGKLKRKFEKKHKKFIEQFKIESKKEKNFFKKYLDVYTNELFNKIFYINYNELFEAIKDYKTFNPLSISIKFDDEEIIHEMSDYNSFFHYTTILLDFEEIPIKHNYVLQIETKKTLRVAKKKEKITHEKIVFPKLIIFLFIGLIAIPLLIFVFISLSIVFYLLILVCLISLIIISLNLIRFEYKYYSPLQDQAHRYRHKLSFFNYYLNKNKNIYSIPVNLRKDCSYYWVINAPRFHSVQITKEIKGIIKNLEQPIVLRTPYESAKNLLSFHIPRGKFIKEVDFQLDLEMPYSARIVGWLIGMNIMLINMLSLSVIYFIIILTINVPIDLSNVRVVLPFLTLLIGFFGKSVLENPTKDLHKWGGVLILLTVILGIILFITSIATLIITPAQ